MTSKLWILSGSILRNFKIVFAIFSAIFFTGLVFDTAYSWFPSNGMDVTKNFNASWNKPTESRGNSSDGKLSSIFTGGYFYNSYENQRGNSWIFNYMAPMKLDNFSFILWRARGEVDYISQRNSGSDNYRSSMISLGGDYVRKVGGLLVAVRGAYDILEWSNTWYSSGNAGLEILQRLSNIDFVDLKLTYYGKYSGDELLGSFRTGPSNYDAQLSYIHKLYYKGPSAIFTLTGYNLDQNTRTTQGWRLAANIYSRNNTFWIKHETGRDPVLNSYYTIGAFLGMNI